MKACSVEGCERKSRARGWCGMHFQRWRKHGDPEVVQNVVTFSLEDALAIRTEWLGECWVWTGSLSPDGYANYNGHESHEHGTHYLHRIIWEREHGKIPEGLEIDHMCFQRNCLNVIHMRLADRSLNTQNLAKLKSNNKTGVRGVHWVTRDNKYVGHVRHRNKAYYVGGFHDLDEAAAAVAAKRKELHEANPMMKEAA